MMPSRWTDDSQKRSGHTTAILVVDDNMDCRAILRTVLEREGFCCEEAEDGVAALRVLQRKSIDFIITDFQMPNMNGCEFLELLSKEANIRLPAVMVTGNLSEAVRIRAFDAGAQAVFSKPVDQKNILKMVCDTMNRKPAALL